MKAQMCPKFGWLCDYQTGLSIRPATKGEKAQSTLASHSDGGVGAFKVEGKTCYVS